MNETLDAQQRRISELNKWRIELQHERSDIMLALRCGAKMTWRGSPNTGTRFALRPNVS